MKLLKNNKILNHVIPNAAKKPVFMRFLDSSLHFVTFRMTFFRSFYLVFFTLIFVFINNTSVICQTDADEEFTEDDEFEWVYINLDLSYGSSGPGGALGFRYRFIGAAISTTGFANDIPKTSRQTSNNQTDLVQKTYPSNTVCGDVYGYYDLEEVSLFANLGFYSSIDSVLLWDLQEQLYYKKGAVTQGGLCFGFGAQMPLTFINEENPYFEQLIGGIGFHSRLGAFLRIAYRW